MGRRVLICTALIVDISSIVGVKVASRIIPKDITLFCPGDLVNMIPAHAASVDLLSILIFGKIYQ